jgi:hypothetical protein
MIKQTAKQLFSPNDKINIKTTQKLGKIKRHKNL